MAHESNEHDESAETLATPMERRASRVAPLTRGASVGRYTILEEVGSGGMGLVYAAYDPQLDRRVALKLMRGSGDPVNRQRLLREAKAMARVQHPAVVAVHDAGEVDDEVFVAMDLVEGSTLNKWLKDGPRPVPEILATFRRAGEGLAAAHAAGLVHRDFKPANVLMGLKGQVAVTDFGLARDAATSTEPTANGRPAPVLPASMHTSQSQSLDPLTQAGIVSGTPQYMAPEQFAGQAVDARADQFAFCVALWDALYGQPPYPAGDVQELVNRIARGDLAQPADRKKVPSHIHRALERGLAPRTEQRFPSMEALLAEIAHDTGRGQRRARALAIGLIALVLAGGGWFAMRGASRRACQASKQRFQAVWTKDAREKVRDAFVTALTREGLPTYASVEASLDLWTSQWTDAHRAACTAGTGGLLDTQVERRLSCLDELRLSQQALVNALAGVDRASAHASSDAVTQLPVPDTCLRGDVPAAAKGEQAAVRAKIAEAEVLTLMVRGKEGEATALEAVELAKAAGLDAELSRAWVQVLLARNHQAKLDEADAAAAEAIIAAERAGDFRLLAFAWTERMYLAAIYQAQWQRAEEAGRHAEVWAQRMGGDPWITARVESLRGMALLQARKPAEAVAAEQRALAAAERAVGKEHLTLVRPLMHLTNAARVSEEFLDDALDASARAMAIQDKFLPAVHPNRAHVLNARGRVLFAAGKNAEALAAHQKAREILEATMPGPHPEAAKTWALIGEVLRANDDVPSARSAFKEALKQTETFAAPNHPLRATLEKDLARLAAAAADEREAAESFERALAGPWPRPVQLELWEGAAQSWLNLNEWKRAQAAAHAGLAIEESAAFHFLLAQAHHGLAEFDESDVALARARATADAGFVVEIDRWVAARPKPDKKTKR